MATAHDVELLTKGRDAALIRPTLIAKCGVTGAPSKGWLKPMVALPPARDASEDVMRALDPELTGSALLPFAVHRSPRVRAAVAARGDCPAGALVSLGHDHDVTVLEALLRNVRTPSSVVRALADHRNQRISDLAVQRLRNGYR